MRALTVFALTATVLTCQPPPASGRTLAPDAAGDAAQTTTVVSLGRADAGRSGGLAGRTVVIDAGHGGFDSGARSADGIEEKTVTLQIALDLAVLLRETGVNAMLTRTTDDDLATVRDRVLHRRQQASLRARLALVRHAHPDAFVSIHCNASSGSAWHGAQTIYMTGNKEGAALALSIQQAFRETLLPTRRQADDMSTLYLLKRISGPATLVEVGFLSHPQEAAALASSTYQRRAAFAIYVGMVRYFAARGLPLAGGDL